MAITEICSEGIIQEKIILRNPNANLLKVEFDNLIQYKTNPCGKEPLMFYIPCETFDFECTRKTFGARIWYRINARDINGKSLNTFNYSL